MKKHAMKFVSQPLRLALALLVLITSAALRPCHGQEIEPRRWGHMPIGADFMTGAYSYTSGDVYLDPVLRIEDGQFYLHATTLKYIHSFDLLGKSARVDLTQSYLSGEWSGVLNGTPASITRDGWADTAVRFAVNLLGAPPLKGAEFASYRAQHAESETIVGAGLAIVLPTGRYLEDKLINLGSNRFTFRPQVGVVHTEGPWSMELTTAAWLFTDNDEFYNGKHLEQDPLFTADASLVYTFRPGLWISGSVGYGIGSETTVNGISSDNRQSSLGYGLSVGLPISRSCGFKLAYIGTRTEARTGLDADTFIGAVTLSW